eukprot:TRINITY_DN10377_c0_g1_i1.p1 TRINITY_DN10377_c0_g1~~TRINITY_DN10377_c0_g1_i1.p1  ORF type:complete len:169 (+),score=67.19 TRINITY_DN10377_c0_g1_i1:24-509(+)
MADNERMEDDVNVDTDESGRRVRGRGGIEPMDAADSERYSGQGAVFERLDNDNLEPGQPIKSVEGWIVFVSGVHEEATEEELMDKFADFGEIRNIQMPLDRRTGFVKGYALIEFGAREEAQQAIETMHGKAFMNKPLNVDWCFAVPAKTAVRKQRGGRDRK